jgi:hypothetical protein
MPLFFNGQEIPGMYSAPLFDRRDLQVQRTKFWGVKGESEIVGEWAGRQIEVNHWFYGGYGSQSEIFEALQALDKRTGENGRLEFTEMGILLYDCTFEGHDLRYGPLYDYAGTLDTGKFWAEIGLRWRHLGGLG